MAHYFENGHLGPGDRPDAFRYSRSRRSRNPFTQPPEPSLPLTHFNNRDHSSNPNRDPDDAQEHDLSIVRHTDRPATVVSEGTEGTQASPIAAIESIQRPQDSFNVITERSRRSHARSPPLLRSGSSEFAQKRVHLRSESHQNLQVIKFPSETKTDTTLHFVLDVADSIDDCLEELSCLKRWGHFKEAHKYFESNLKQHLDLPLVAIEYADLFLKQSAYRDSLELHLELPKKGKLIPVVEVSSPNLYEAHFDWIQINTRFAFESLSVYDLDFERIGIFSEYFDLRAYPRRTTQSTNDMGLATPFDSTEVQIICNQLELQSQILARSPNLFAKRLCLEIECWGAIYNDLLMGGRVWELSDLAISMFRFFGPSKTWALLYSTGAKADDPEPPLNDSLERLYQDWAVNEYDESTELAILTILVQLICELTPRHSTTVSKESAKDINLCLQHANTYASKIRKHSPDLIESRPFLLLVVAKETADRRMNSSPWYEKAREWHFTNTVRLKNGLYFPIYIPSGSENRGWLAPDSRFPPNKSLRWVLQKARELEDYAVESKCLCEMICRVEDPRPLFEELGSLQQSRQGDNLAYFDSCLAQYQLTTDNASRCHLIRKLEEASHQLKPSLANDVCISMRKNGLKLQQGLCHSCPEYQFLIEENEEILEATNGNPYRSRGKVNKHSRSEDSRRNGSVEQASRLGEAYTDIDRIRKEEEEKEVWVENDISDWLPRPRRIERRQRQDYGLERHERDIEHRMEEYENKLKECEKRLALVKEEVDARSRKGTSKGSHNANDMGARHRHDEGVQTRASAIQVDRKSTANGLKGGSTKGVTWNLNSSQSSEIEGPEPEQKEDLSKAVSWNSNPFKD